MNKILKLGFTDTIDSIANFFVKILSSRFDVIRNDVNPDYLIFGDKNFGNNNVNFNNRKCIKIFYTGENQRPWDYQCHYAISFDHIDNERHYRLPLYIIYDYDNRCTRNPPTTNIETYNREFSDLNDKKKFCCFIVKNGGCEKRNNFFHRLSEYKKVDSAGPLFNNVGYILDRGEKMVEAKFDFMKDYKFNLCFENSSWPGYTTEKIYDAFMAKTVPIYWGSPTIEVDFNPKAFLNWHDYKDDDIFLQKIIELDNDPDYYTEMYLEPMFIDHKKTKFFDMELFLNWFEKNVYKGILNE